MSARKTLIAVWTATVVAAHPVVAQSALDQVVQQLEQQNFSEIEVRRTLLGRIRVTATGNGRAREVVLNPSTGAILRDYTSAPEAPAARARDEDSRRGQTANANTRESSDRSAPEDSSGGSGDSDRSDRSGTSDRSDTSDRSESDRDRSDESDEAEDSRDDDDRD